ncbi:MAG: SLC13 family permease, partial [bacterium]
MMTWEGWFTLAVTALTVYLLARGLIAPASAMLGATILLLLFGIIEPGEAFAGFGNPAPVTVAALYIIARAAEKTGLMQPVIQGLLGRSSGRKMLARLVLPSAGASAVLNNTPIVAMLVPVVTDWADRHRLPPSRFLMPLSFAVILGGALTAIGTSTNLVVSGLLEERGLAPMGFFEITPLGLPLALGGLLLLVLLAPLLLPPRAPAREDLGTNVREFTMNLEVIPGGWMDG